MEIPPLVADATTLPGGKHVTGFSVAYGSLRIQFLWHPRKRGTITRAYCRVDYEETVFQSFIVPPLSGGKVVP